MALLRMLFSDLPSLSAISPIGVFLPANVLNELMSA